MTTAHITELDWEVDRVEQWRLASLERAGYDLGASLAAIVIEPVVEPLPSV